VINLKIQGEKKIKQENDKVKEFYKNKSREGGKSKA
jgi:hypothetical protein